MTYTTEKVFEKYEVRKTKDQRAKFRQFVHEMAEYEGYDCVSESAGSNARNIIVGSPSTAKVVFTAHYDTCAGTPFPNFITPKRIHIYILYQLLICLCLYTVPILVMTLVPSLILKCGGNGTVATIFFLLGYVLLFLACFLLMFGPANKHNANDNTSGVCVLLDLMQEMPGAYREDVAFIFFDLEERGCIGSQYYRKKHARDMKKKFVLNFDCVGDGKTMLFVVKNKARPYIDMLKKAFPSTDTITTEIASKGVFYPSDQRSFEHGVGVGAFKTHEKGYLYLDRIHTKYDTKFDEENIEYLVNGSVKLIENWDYDEEANKKSLFPPMRKKDDVRFKSAEHKSPKPDTKDKKDPESVDKEKTNPKADEKEKSDINSDDTKKADTNDDNTDKSDNTDKPDMKNDAENENADKDDIEPVETKD